MGREKEPGIRMKAVFRRVMVGGWCAVVVWLYEREVGWEMGWCCCVVGC